MAFQDHYLWIVGSHSIKRKRIKRDSSTDEDQIEKLAKLDDEGNRYLLARIPLVTNPLTNEPELHTSVPDPSNSARTLTAAQLRGNARGNRLMDALKCDRHLDDFLSIPGKDNGFDVEGLAVTGERIFLGLRGPVLRGWAVVLELEVGEDEGDLKLKKIGPDGRRYRKHFLELDGLGVRELCVDGDDLLILAGPTMDLDGPVTVVRWRNGVERSSESVTWRGDNLVSQPVPYKQDTDHAEGMTLFESGGRARELLIVYDAPHDDRKQAGDTAVMTDVFKLP
jgi:hypothetical protein